MGGGLRVSYRRACARFVGDVDDDDDYDDGFDDGDGNVRRGCDVRVRFGGRTRDDARDVGLLCRIGVVVVVAAWVLMMLMCGVLVLGMALFTLPAGRRKKNRREDERLEMCVRVYV